MTIDATTTTANSAERETSMIDVMKTAKPKIYLYCIQTDSPCEGDVMGYAIAEDGHCVAGHLSSNLAFSQHDLGLTSDWKHDKYAKHYPGGYELEWVDDLDTHAGFQAAFARNQELSKQRECLGHD